MHRDVALRNLLVSQVDGKYVVKVADFGLARHVIIFFLRIYSDNFKSSEVNLDAKQILPIKWTAAEVLNGDPLTAKNDVWVRIKSYHLYSI